MSEFDKEEREELIQMAMERLGFSRPAAEIYVDCSDKLLNAAEIFSEIDEYISAVEKENMRKTLINLAVGWFYQIDVNDNVDLISESLFEPLDYIRKEAK